MSILSMYRADLQKKLNDLWCDRATQFLRRDLLLWYNKERITNTVWRDILEEWNNFCGDSAPIELEMIKYDDYSPVFTVVQKDEGTDFKDLI